MSSNREFMAAHLARQAQRRAAEAFPACVGAQPQTSDTLHRVDVSVDVVTSATGLTEAQLEALIPNDWRFEKDWRTLGGKVYFNRASLALLVGVLSTSGEPHAAAGLMNFLSDTEPMPARGRVTIKDTMDAIESALTPSETRIDLKASAGRGGTDVNGESCGLGCPNRKPAAPASEKKSWAQKWEETHE